MITIDSSYFNAGLVVENGMVTEAAPIIRYMVGWSVQRVKDYSLKKNWSIYEH